MYLGSNTIDVMVIVATSPFEDVNKIPTVTRYYSGENRGYSVLLEFCVTVHDRNMLKIYLSIQDDENSAIAKDENLRAIEY